MSGPVAAGVRVLDLALNQKKEIHCDPELPTDKLGRIHHPAGCTRGLDGGCVIDAKLKYQQKRQSSPSLPARQRERQYFPHACGWVSWGEVGTLGEVFY